MKPFTLIRPDADDRAPSVDEKALDATPLLRLATSMAAIAMRVSQSRVHCANRVAVLAGETELLIRRSLELVSKQRALVSHRRELLARRRQVLAVRRRELQEISTSLRLQLQRGDDGSEPPRIYVRSGGG